MKILFYLGRRKGYSVDLHRVRSVNYAPGNHRPKNLGSNVEDDNISALVIVGVVLLAQGFALKLPPLPKQQQALHKFIQKFERLPSEAARVGVDLCPGCIDFTGQAIDQLLNIILNGGVVGGCSELCGLLPSKALGLACNLLCDVVGIELFMDAIKKADLDPIYFCELITVCPVNDQGDAQITTFGVSPLSGPQGEKVISFAYHSNNGTGTGEIVLLVETVDGVPIESAFLHELAGPGDYSSQFKLKAQPDPNCDPTQQICEQWLPRNYTVRVDICNGECGSKHPHSQIYDKKSTSFIITQ
ncbi:hypothetical protein ScPMuIL_014183 [Solemya velum]